MSNYKIEMAYKQGYDRGWWIGFVMGLFTMLAVGTLAILIY